MKPEEEVTDEMTNAGGYVILAQLAKHFGFRNTVHEAAIDVDDFAEAVYRAMRKAAGKPRGCPPGKLGKCGEPGIIEGENGILLDNATLRDTR